MTNAAMCGIVLTLVGCGPSAPPIDGESEGDADAAGSADTRGDAADGSISLSSSAGSTVGPSVTDDDDGSLPDGDDGGLPDGDDGGLPKLDVEPPARADPCGPLREVEPTECYPPAIEYPASSLSWPLETENGVDCALVCLLDHCVTDVCFDTPEELRVVHDGAQMVFAPPNLQKTGSDDAIHIEGWNGRIRVHVEHDLATDTYAVWANTEPSGEPLWGPILMQWYGG